MYLVSLNRKVKGKKIYLIKKRKEKKKRKKRQASIEGNDKKWNYRP